MNELSMMLDTVVAREFSHFLPNCQRTHSGFCLFALLCFPSLLCAAWGEGEVSENGLKE